LIPYEDLEISGNRSSSSSNSIDDSESNNNSYSRKTGGRSWVGKGWDKKAQGKGYEVTPFNDESSATPIPPV